MMTREIGGHLDTDHALAKYVAKEAHMDEMVNTHSAKTRLSQLLAKAEAGHTVIIARDGKPVARLVPVAPKGKREFGALRGKLIVGPEFFEPLPEEELAAWGQ